MNDFGKRLEGLRQRDGKTKKQMSDRLGYSQNTYGNYERGDREPQLETIKDLAEIYNVSIDYLVTGDYATYQVVADEDIKKIKRLINRFRAEGIDEPYFLQTDKWEDLSKEDLEELTKHFEWIVYKARNRED